MYSNFLYYLEVFSLSLSLLVRWLKSSCCGLHRLSPLFPVLCHLGCLMQSTIQPFLNIRVPGSLRSSSATSAFHLSLDDDFLQPIMSNGMTEKTQVFCELFAVDVDVDGLRTKPSGCSPIQYWSFVLLDTLYSWQSVWRSSFWCAHATAHFDWKFCRRQTVQTDLNVTCGCSVGYWFVSEGEGLDWPLTRSYVCLKVA